MAIDQFNPESCSTVDGQFLLRGCQLRNTRSGAPFKALTLHDATGRVTAYAWEASGTLEQIPGQDGAAVQAHLNLRRLNNRIVANVQHIRPLECYEVHTAAELLPYEDCPKPTRPALAKLVAFNQSLAPDDLRQFLNRVLLDHAIGIPLLRCKGSQQHHHAEIGGLLTHSMEVAAIASDMAAGRLSGLECAIVELGALLHDIGKLRSVGATTTRPVHTQIVRHESQTQRLLEPHLTWLRQRCPEAATGLEYILDFLARPKQQRGYATFLGAELVINADHMSAALANEKRLAKLLDKTTPGRRRNNGDEPFGKNAASRR